MRSCINFCAQIWDFTVAPTPTQVCPVDACDQSVFDDAALDVRVCPANSECRPSVAGSPTGTCRLRLGFLDQCGDPSPGDPYDMCGEGLACTPASCVASAFRGGPPHGDRPLCWTPAREGQACDSNLADRDFYGAPLPGEAARCAPCEAGTWCVARADIDGHGAPNARICVRSCTDTTGGGSFPNDALCSCGGETRCILPQNQHIMDPFTEAQLGPFFCTPCLRTSAPGCAAGDAAQCCDGDATCTFASDFLIPGQSDICCRPPVGLGGAVATCDPNARIDQCCPGAACVRDTSSGSGHCQSCGHDGGAPVAGLCCPGHRGVGSATRQVCARCSDERHILGLRSGEDSFAACSDETLAFFGAPGTVDGFFVPSSRVNWPNQFTGGIGANLVNTGLRVRRTEYLLSPTHHTFLFGALINEPTTAVSSGTGGTPFLELPPDNVPGTATSAVALPAADWRSFRTYDSGECSALLPWASLAAAVSARLHHELSAPSMRSTFRGLRNNGGLTLTPVLQGTPADPPGLIRPDDHIRLEANYHVDSVSGIEGCANLDVRITAMVDVNAVQGFNVGPEARADDAAVLAAGCTITPDGGTYLCNVPRLVDFRNDRSGYMSTVIRFPRGVGFYAPDRGPLEQIALDDLFTTFACRADRYQYVCHNLPTISEDLDCCPVAGRGPLDCPVPVCGGPDAVSFYPGSAGGRLFITCFPGVTCEDPTLAPYHPILNFRDTTVLRNRRVQRVIGSQDLVLTLRASSGPGDPSLSIDLIPDRCGLEEVITGIAEGIAARAFQRLESVDSILSGLVGRNGVADFGLPVESLATCAGLRPDGSLNDDLCWASPRFGGERHTCAPWGVCDVLRIEPRRLNFRPDGIEVVLAEGPGDPQRALIRERPPLLPSLPTVSCSPERFYPLGTRRAGPYALGPSAPPGRAVRRYLPADLAALSTLSAATSATLLGDGALAFCDPTVAAPATTCICPQTGTVCNNLRVAASGLSVPTDPATMAPAIITTCRLGLCCDTSGSLCVH